MRKMEKFFERNSACSLINKLDKKKAEEEKEIEEEEGEGEKTQSLIDI